MWFRDLKGELVEIKRNSFNNDKVYFNYIKSKIFDYKPPKESNVLQSIADIIAR